MIIVRCLESDRKALKSIRIDPAEIADDGTDYSGIPVRKPWGWEIEKYRDENVAIWWLTLDPHQETSMHCHPHKTTLLMIVEGQALICSLKDSHPLHNGEIAVIEKGAFHRTRSIEGSLILYELETPPNKRDLVRLEDSYGRGQGYERIVSRVP